MKPFFRNSALPFLMTLPFYATAAEVLPATGSFLSEIAARRQVVLEHFSSDSNAYDPPTPQEIASMAAIVGHLRNGDLQTAAALAEPLNYEVVRFTDTDENRVYLGLRETGPTHGWGSFYLNPSASSRVHVHVNHPQFDFQTPDLGARIFQAVDGQALLMAGAHRHANGQGTADVAHLAESVFQTIHETWTQSALTRVLSIHGFSAGTRDDNNWPADTQVVLSHGDGTLSQRLVDLDTALESVLTGASYAYNASPDNARVNGDEPGLQFGALAGSQNTQGVSARARGHQFIHIEHIRAVRETAASRRAIASAFGEAFPVLGAVDSLEVSISEPGSANGILVLSLSSNASERYEIETSSDLETWSPRESSLGKDGPLEFALPLGGNPEFFRASADDAF